MPERVRRAIHAVPWGLVWIGVGAISMAALFAYASIELAGSPQPANADRPAAAISALRCAAGDAGIASNGPAASSRPGSSTMLVPAGATEVLLCRYAGLGAPAPVSSPAAAAPTGRAATAPSRQAAASTGGRFTLVRERLVSSTAVVHELADGLDAIRPTAPGTIFCPADFGGLILAHFRYASGPADLVTIETSGCEIVTNGRVHRLAGDAAVIGRIEALVPAPTEPR